MNSIEIKKELDIIKYSSHEIDNFKNGKVKIVYDNEDIISFVKESILHSSNAKLYYGKVGNNFSSKIKEILNINVFNYNISLSSSAVRHIFKNHGNVKNEILRGQIMVVEKDFELISLILFNYDNLKLSGMVENNNLALAFKKRFDVNYHVIAYISHKNHNIEIKTMWKTKIRKRTLPLLLMY